MRVKFIEDWTCKWWRFWSLRLNALGLLILSWCQFDPVGVLYVWSMMPVMVQEVLPRNFVVLTGMALTALAMIARLVTQPAIQEKIDAKKS
jgi:hypothetical protein